MKISTRLALQGIIAVAAIPLVVFAASNHTAAEEPLPAPAPQVVEPTLTHAQEVWKSALEWCESRGLNAAVNEKDVDGTPSYYSFQFKPSTFADLAERYGVAGKISDYAAQDGIVTHMILDPRITAHQWRYQYFPDCVRKLGQPPSGG